jgi:phage-related minor tail protein
MQTGYAPEAQLLNQLQVGTNIASIADTARRQAAMEKAESAASGLEANLEAQKLRAGLLGQALGSAGQVIGGGVGGGGLFSSLIGAANEGGGLNDLPDFIKKLLGII